jgi:L-cysteine S-thiosulfotransferase
MKSPSSIRRTQDVRLLAFLACSAAMLGAGCYHGPKSGYGFQLPDGDPFRGRAAFIELKCTNCHAVDGVQLPAPTVAPENVVMLGGEVERVKTYGQLVTAIIHPTPPALPAGTSLPPTATLTRPKMVPVNDRMSVEQLVDLVVFLQPHYKQIEVHPSYTDPRGFPASF